MKAAEVFHQNNGDVTKAYYEKLNGLGPAGRIATCLLRAQKRSTRAKQYRRGRWRREAYGVKEWSLGELCRELAEHATELNIRWGWKQDHNVQFGEQSSWVLYVELPLVTNQPSLMSAEALEAGAAEELQYSQVSFHSPDRLQGPLFDRDWDGAHLSAERIIRFCDSVAESVRATDEVKHALVPTQSCFSPSNEAQKPDQPA